MLAFCVAATALADDAEPVRTLLADLSPEVREALSVLEGEPLASRGVAEQLEAVFEAATPYEFDVGVLFTYTDPRWFSSLGPSGPGAPLLELRRWPGDTVLSLYALAGPLSTQRETGPPLADAELTLQPGATEQRAEWIGTLRTEVGDQPIVWIETRVGEASAVLGSLLLPGDAGLGPGAVSDLLLELRDRLDHVVVRPELWARHPGMAQGERIAISPVGATPEAKTESRDPWQIALGSSFSLGVPPGFRARRMDGDVPPPVEPAGGLLWMRGRYTDVEGQMVVVGDGERVGYVAEVKEGLESWSEGGTPPLGAAAGSLAAADSFALLKEHTGCRSARAERWREPGFEGDWLVFRLLFDERGIEIGLPVLEGRRSASLFWIAASWRGAGEAPAPPPVDPAERFGIRFEQLSRGEKARRPWMEGFLIVPGLRAELPVGWWPAASVRSTDGYPIRLVTMSGNHLATLTRIETDELAALNLGEEGSGWQAEPRPGVNRARAIYQRQDGAILYVAKEGGGFLFEVVTPEAVTAETWERLANSVQLMRSER